MSVKNTRVRYETQTNGSLVSVQSYVAGTDIVSIQITQDLVVTLNQFTGDNANLGNTLLTMRAVNLAEAKRLAKSMLKDRGVHFHDEVRNTLTSALELTDSTVENTVEPVTNQVAV
jgi:hypothetical protein